MRDAGEIIEEIALICDVYENRERLPFMGTAQLFDDSVARLLLLTQLTPLIEEFNESMKEGTA